MTRTKWFYCLIFAWALLFVSTICANLCLAEESQATEHSCCPDSSKESEKESEKKDSASEECCGQHEVSLVNTAQNLTSLDPHLSLCFLVITFDDLYASSGAKNLYQHGNPPIFLAKAPLFILKNVFII